MDDIKYSRRWAHWCNSILQILPCRCSICQRSGQSLLCDQCRAGLQHDGISCTQCGESLTDASSHTNQPLQSLCGTCLSRPPAYQRTIFAYRYSGDMARLIHQYKYSETLILSRLLAELIIAKLREEMPAAEFPDILVPVPLHPARLRQRGFNPSLELARRIGKELDIPVHPHLINRRRDTPSQTGLNRRKRELNMRGAFCLKKTRKQDSILGKHLAIVDDVVTTGATAREVARVLSGLKPDRISILTVAKTQR